MEKLALIFAFLYIISATCSWVGTICFSRKSYNDAFMAFSFAFFSLLVVSFTEFYDYNGMTWSIVGTLVVGGIQFVLLTISCFRDSPTKREISAAKLETAGEMGEYMRPYYHQMKRVIWKLRKQDAYDSVRIYRYQRNELETKLASAKTDMDRDSYTERLALVTEKERRWTKCCNKINSYEKQILSKYSDPEPTKLLDA